MAKALISIENQSPSDWDLMQGDNSKLLKFLATAGLELCDIDIDSVKTFPEIGPGQGIVFETGDLPVISFSRIAAVSVGHPSIISTTINFIEPVIVQGRAKRL